MIITQILQVTIKTNTQREHYRDIGINANIKDTISIKPEQLPNNSGENILVKCDYCGEEFLRKWKHICKGREIIQKDACKNCLSLKRKETYLVKYGVENPAQLPEVQEKIKKTNLERYGCENAMQNKKIVERVQETNLERWGTITPLLNSEIKEKTKKTCIEKYGAETFQKSEIGRNIINATFQEKFGGNSPFCSKEIQQKRIKTCKEKFGVEYPLQSEEILDKVKDSLEERFGVRNIWESKEILNHTKQTNIEKYGVEFPFEKEEFRIKADETTKERYGRSFVFTSATQKRLSELFCCEINFSIGGYFADLYLGNNIVCEYDGGFHNGSVQLGHITEEEFEQKELAREDFIISEGYKIIRIINSLDKNIDDSKYIEIKNSGVELLKNSNYSVYYYDVNTKTEKYR